VRAQGAQAHDEDDEEVSEEEKQRFSLPEGVEVFRITGPVFFGVAGNMIDTLHAIGRTPRVLIVRMGQSPYMDVAGLNGLKVLVDECLGWGTKVVFSGLQEQPAEMMRKGGIFDKPSLVASAPDYESAITFATRLAVQSEADGSA
jgi:SulP family sulfate permease